MGVSKDVQFANETNKQIHESDNAFNAQQAELNRQFQAEQTEKQNQWNLDLWNQNNEYNTPQNQVERLVAAGINPNMYGSISSGTSTSTASSSSTPSGSQASAASPIAMQSEGSFEKTIALVDSIVNGGTALASSFFGNSSTAANTRAANAQTRLVNAQAEKQEIENNISKAEDANLSDIAMYINRNDGNVLGLSDYDSLPDSEKSAYRPVTFIASNSGYKFGENKGAVNAAATINSMFRKVADNKAGVLQARLSQMIYGQQLDNKQVVEDLATMPIKQFELLNENINKTVQELKNAGVTYELLRDQHGMNGTQKKIIEEELDTMQNSNLSKWFNNLTKKGDISASDLFRGLILGFMQFAKAR